MKFILKLLSVFFLTSLSVININACGVEQGPPQIFNATFDKINKFKISAINISLPVMDLKLYKDDVTNPTGFLTNFYNKDGYIKIEISGSIFNKFLSVYNLTINNNENEIKNKLSNTNISNGNITIIKYVSYVNFYYLSDFSGKIQVN